MSDTYKTIQSVSEGLYKEKGSKFISVAIPVRSIEEVKEHVKEYRKQYFDARHVCYAYMIGHARTEFRANDDGEPSGTAGRPILGQLNANELTDVLVIVIRYFGGVLLGTGGLVQAYKEATADALKQAQIIEKTINEQFSINFEYILMNDVMRVIKECEPQILEQKFDNNCSMLLEIRKNDAAMLLSKLEKIIGLQIA